jgi:para-nitrobenzyl esterase
MSVSRRDVLRSGAGILGAVGLSPLFAQSGAAPVPTSHGQVRGYTDDGIEVFKGIRYGADTAPRRFRPPLPPQAWDGVVDCFEYGASSPQNRSNEKISEDCLFLNIWTPAVDDGRKRPVMFYIHGGAYNHGSGSSPLYDGRALAAHGDVVVVTVNHRLNAFGYLYLQRLAPNLFPDSGNCGQLDLVLALKWVRENIAAFGGDPERILAFGQSGGGAKIATMMAMPAAKGLFQRAASMSGQQVTASGPANATERTMAYLDELKTDPEDIHRLLAMPFEKLVTGLDARDPVLTYDTSVYFGPVLDMRSLTRHPFYPDAAPQSADIPMIIGNTHDETRAFLRDPAYYDLSWADVPELLVPNMRVDIRPEYVVDEYRRIYPEYTPSQVFFAATTAARSWRGAIIEAEERAKQDGANTFVYQLDFQSPVKPELGAPHTFDIPLVFRNLEAPASLAGAGAESRSVSSMMSEAFISFARAGAPESSSLPKWTPFKLNDRQTMIFDISPRMESDPRGEERRVFERVPYVQPGT